MYFLKFLGKCWQGVFGSHFFKVSWDFWGQYYLLLAMHPFPWYITMFTVWYPPKHVKSYFVPVSMEAFSRWSYWMHMATHEYLILDECWRWIQHSGVNGKLFWIPHPVDVWNGSCLTLPCTCRWWGPPQRLGTTKQANRIFSKTDRETRNCLNVVTWLQTNPQIFWYALISPHVMSGTVDVPVALDEVDFAVPKCIWIKSIKCSTCSKCNNGYTFDIITYI